MNAKKIELTPNRVKQKVKNAIEVLFRKDSHLLKIDVNERSITHKLALYLQDEFKGWDVDCEYNRNRYDTKKLIIGDDIHLKAETTRTDDEHGNTVYPDIIVHRRGTDQNLLVVEVKKTTTHVPNDFDLGKLREYKRQLGYSHAIFLNFITGSAERTGVGEEIWIGDDS